MPELTRRAFVALIGGYAATASAASAQPLAAAPATRFSSVVVDTGPLLARGLWPQAQLIGAVLATEARRSLADRLGGAGPRLVVRLTGLSMSLYTGGGSGFGRGGGGDNDYLEGEALVVGRRGELLARYPQLSVLPSSGGGAWYDPQSERRRIIALAQHYGWWLRRTVPG